ncbi:MAG TPA: hypothetical protein VGJ87_13875 [Roseiflexaceae bacterium]
MQYEGHIGVFGDISIQRAAARHVQDLEAAADAEKRLLLAERPACEGQFGLVARGIHAADYRARAGAVPARFNIAAT